MLRIVVGSHNPAKVQAVKNVFKGERVEIISLNVASGVQDQPFSDEETIEGAINRARNGLTESDAQIGIGLEGGVVETKHGLFLCNWGALAVRESSDVFIAGGARILLPDTVANRLLAGEELGPVMDEFTNRAGIRKKEGAIGVFTNERITRADMFSHIMNMLVGQYEYKIGQQR
ncbi:DUF84 family protein [Peribacillus huizhouensis]|uniref:Probable inosine/xanthosine triphosphatase n=1 Tax=Peribacillus huizhouensis TaxID=1501239 RepID=A0ABR6CML9_9BACI|nr:DUF84 family protein [Peribacillus huizhouensis]MBA9026254.1 inosine/xanthosine triphosphatase [Peribacillus huizhouensis]